MLVQLCSGSLSNKESKALLLHELLFFFLPSKNIKELSRSWLPEEGQAGTNAAWFYIHDTLSQSRSRSLEWWGIPERNKLFPPLIWWSIFSGALTGHFRPLANWTWQTLVRFPDLAIEKVSSHMCWSNSLWRLSLTLCEVGCVLF